MEYLILIIPSSVITGFILDIIFGDPRRLRHPVRIMGSLAKKIEPAFRKPRAKKLSGLLFALAIIICSGLCSAVILALPAIFLLHSRFAAMFFFFVLSSFIIYTCLALKDLKVQSLKVYRDLQNADIEAARLSLSNIVGRDTSALGRENIIRATVETIAENSVDGVLSPLFYAFLGGPPLSMAFKAASTLDSMYGYRDGLNIYFGWASARIDDIANYIPARLSALLIPLASLVYGKGFLNPFKTVLKFRKNSPSPNSGIPEAAIAGALGLRLGGEDTYGEKKKIKPFIGDATKGFDLKDIIDSINIVYIFSILSAIAGFLLFSATAALFFLK